MFTGLKDPDQNSLNQIIQIEEGITQQNEERISH